MSSNKALLIKEIERLLMLGRNKQLSKAEGDLLIAYQTMADARFEDIPYGVWLNFAQHQTSISVILREPYAGESPDGHHIAVKWLDNVSKDEVFKTI
jgi:hypothetical protein